MADPAPIRGRWTIVRRIDWQPSYTNPYIVPPGVDPPESDEQLEVLAVVPVPDEAAIERGAKAVHASRGLSSRSYSCPGCECRELALAVLRAALEAPDDQ